MASCSIAFSKNNLLVTVRSSATIWHLAPIDLFNSFHPFQSFSSNQSSIEIIG